MRRALYQAVDIETIKTKLMRGQAYPTGGITPSPLGAYNDPEIEKRLPYDLDAAKKLMADAGWADGFEVTLDCPNNRYINDEEICQTLAAMWAKLNVKIRVNGMPRSTYFPKVQKYDTSMYMLGWGGAITDAETTLTPVLRSRGEGGVGAWNFGGYVDAKFDELAAASSKEADPKKREAADQGGAEAAQRAGPPHPAAPAGDPVGGAAERRCRAPRRQLARMALDHDQVSAPAARPSAAIWHPVLAADGLAGAHRSGGARCFGTIWSCWRAAGAARTAGLCRSLPAPRHPAVARPRSTVTARMRVPRLAVRRRWPLHADPGAPGFIPPAIARVPRTSTRRSPMAWSGSGSTRRRRRPPARSLPRFDAEADPHLRKLLCGPYAVRDQRAADRREFSRPGAFRLCP